MSGRKGRRGETLAYAAHALQLWPADRRAAARAAPDEVDLLLAAAACRETAAALDREWRRRRADGRGD